MNPLDLSGPEFLLLYVILLAVAGALGVLLRYRCSGPLDEPQGEALELDAYEVAYLAGGEKQAIQAAVATLVHTGHVSVERQAGCLLRGRDLPAGRPGLEKAIHGIVKPKQGIRVDQVYTKAAPTARQSARRLRELGLVLPAERVGPVRLATVGPLFAVLVLGIAKVFVGLQRDRPVEFLLLLLVGTLALVGILYFWWKPLRTGRGGLALQRLKQENSALSYTSRHEPARLAHDDLVLALALFGMGVVDSEPLRNLRAARGAAATSSSGGGWFFSCSMGTSCGSGSSCGGSSCGGGCGGGGCGGCGSS